MNSLSDNGCVRPWECLKSRAALGAIRMALLFTGAAGLFPLGCWLVLEDWETLGWPACGGALLLATAGVLAEGMLQEARRVTAWNTEAERLRWQEENDFPPPGGAADFPGGEPAASCGGGSYYEVIRDQSSVIREQPRHTEGGAER